MPAELSTTEIIKEYCVKFPKCGDLTLAKVIYGDYPHLFRDVELVRQRIRYINGHHGKQSRKNRKDKTTMKPITNDSRPFKSPPSLANTLETWILPKSIKKVLFLCDIHLPEHHEKHLDIAINYGIKQGCDAVFLNGDILDMYQVSFHEKNPTKQHIREEFDMGKQFLSDLKSAFPQAKIYYKEGNHEKRWRRYLMLKAPEIFGDAEFELPSILKLGEKKIEWIWNETLVKFGKLNVIHGNEFKGGGGVNPARSLYLKAKSNCIAGDKHKTGENNEGSLNEELITTWSVGCLCDLNPEYMPFAHTIWNHGFAIIEMDGDNFRVKNYRIYKGKIL